MDTGWNCTLLSPLGLTRTGRAPLSLVVDPVLNDDLYACLAHLPRALIPVPNSGPTKMAARFSVLPSPSPSRYRPSPQMSSPGQGVRDVKVIRSPLFAC